MQGFAHILLVGHSYGTYLVNRLASEQLDRVAGVVLIGAGYPVPGAGRLRWIFHLPLFVSASYYSLATYMLTLWLAAQKQCRVELMETLSYYISSQNFLRLSWNS